MVSKGLTDINLGNILEKEKLIQHLLKHLLYFQIKISLKTIANVMN